MITLRTRSQRGHAEHGWLDSWHTFSFADYYDPKHMGYSDLRVINEDFIEGGEGFPTHPHKDMEIFTYVIDGAVQHKDSTGNEGVIRPGEVQIMSAGTGIRHSEFNHYHDRITHLLQIWILPDKNGLAPSYAQKNFAAEFNHSKLILLASPEGVDGSLLIHQNCRIFRGALKSGSLPFECRKDRHYWLQMVRGELTTLGQSLQAGDGAAISDEQTLNLQCVQPYEFLLFDLN